MLVQKIKDLPKIGSIPNLISLDTETKRDKSIEGYSFAYAVGNAIKSFYTPLNHDFSEGESLRYSNVNFDLGVMYLKNLCKNRRMIFHNAQFDLGVLADYGIKVQLKNVEDTLLMHWMLDTERLHGLKPIMKNEYGIETVSYDEAKLLGFDEFAKYGDNDARYTLFLYSQLIKEMRKHENTYESYRKYEIPFIRVMMGMNKYNNGVRIDYKLLKKYGEMVDFEINSLYELLKSKMGDINFNSTKQLAPVLEKFGYKVKYNAPTIHMIKMARNRGEEAVGNPSLGEGELVKLQKSQGGKIIEVLLYYRGMVKLNSTYISSYLEKVEKISDDVWELRGYNFNHTGTRHGRLSSSNPNQQNIVRDVILFKMNFLNILQSKGIISDSVEYLDGKQLSKIINAREKEVTEKFKKHEKDILDAFEKSSVDIRKLYIPHPGMIYLGIDFSQIELRMMAHFSKDKVMLDAYNNGEDIHAKTRDGINKIVGKEIMDRQFGKLTNFFLQYGGYIKSLAEMLGVSRKVAANIYYGFEKLYAGRTAWIKKTHIDATRSHFVQTIFGRRRNVGTIGITDLNNFVRRNNALNGSVSTVISGSSSDLIKIAMLKVNKLKDVYIKLQIHDELLIEVPEEKADILLPKVKSLMENAMSLDVPIEADGKKGYSWRASH